MNTYDSNVNIQAWIESNSEIVEANCLNLNLKWTIYVILKPN